MFENHNISMFNRKGKLYLQFYVNGKLKQKSTRLQDTPANRKLVQKEVIPKLYLMLKNGELSKQKPKEFDFYASIYLRQKENLKTYNELYNIITNQFYKVFGKNTIISEIKKTNIKEWVDKKLITTSPKRVKRLLQILAAIFDIAIEYEHIENNPANNLKLPKHTPIREMKPFTPKEVNLLLSNAEGWFKNMLAFLFYTGVRTGEMLAITWSDVDFNNMTIRINKSKRHGVLSTPKTKTAIRKVPIFTPLLPFLEKQMEFCKNSNPKTLNVFFNPRTKKEFFGVKHIHNDWRKLLEKVNIPYRVIYNTRHTFAINMIRSGVNIADVSQMLGHKSIRETLESYAKFLPEEYLKMKRDIDPFTDNPADTMSQNTIKSMF